MKIRLNRKTDQLDVLLQGAGEGYEFDTAETLVLGEGEMPGEVELHLDADGFVRAIALKGLNEILVNIGLRALVEEIQAEAKAKPKGAK